MSNELFDKMIRHLCVEIHNSELTEELLEELQRLFNEHKGSKDLKFKLKDESIAANIQMISSEWQIDPNGELVNQLSELGLTYSLT